MTEAGPDVAARRPVGRPRKDPVQRKEARAAYMRGYYEENMEVMKANVARSRERQKVLAREVRAGAVADAI